VTTSWSIPNSPPGGPQALACGPFYLDVIAICRYHLFVTPSDFKKDYEVFATHYSQMSDGELIKLALESSTLSDTAWDALEDELDRRQLEVPEPELSPQIKVPEKRDLVVLRAFRDMPEALLAKGRLQVSGIECFLADENMVRMDWFISNLLGGIKLMVQPADFSRASRILSEQVSDESDSESEGAVE
jgi:Putative prokaryotic signal transducing protein